MGKLLYYQWFLYSRNSGICRRKLDKVEKRLNKLFTAMRSKYYLFITDPVVEGIDSLDETKVTFRISAETIPGEGASGSRILRKRNSKSICSRRY